MEGDLANNISRSSSKSSFGSSNDSMQQPVSPKSPPTLSGALDLYGKRRHLVKVQVLEREISLLQEELKSMESLQSVSMCCKEVDDSIAAKQDPLVARFRGNEEIKKSNTHRKRLICWLQICCFRGREAQEDRCCKNSSCCVCRNTINQSRCCCCCRHFQSGCGCFIPPTSMCTKVNLCSTCSKGINALCSCCCCT